jgi:copper transport protein
MVAVMLAVSAALLGHPAAVNVPTLAVGVDAVHVLAAGGWAGAILALSAVAVPQLGRTPAHDRLPLVRTMLRAFSPLALICATALLITGATIAWLHLPDLESLVASQYGLALLRKVVIVVMIAAVGAYHWRVAQPRLDSERAVSRLRASLAIDVVLVLVVLVLTAVLTGTAPPVR